MCCVLDFGVLPGVQASSSQDRGRARKLFLDAKRLVKDGRVPEAIVKLERAYGLFPNPGILVTISYRYLDMGEPEEAAAAMSRIQDPDAQTRRLLKTLRQEVEKQLALPVRVEIKANARNATVSVDGQAARPLPAELELPRGKHRFTFRAPGRSDLTLSREFRGSAMAGITARLAYPAGTWRVKVLPDGDLKDVRVLFNGKAVALTATERTQTLTDAREVKSGTYGVNCLRGVDEIVTAQVTITSAKESVISCEFPSRGPSVLGTYVAWGSAGWSVVGLAAGIGLFMSYDTDVELYASPPGRYEIDSNKQEFGGVLIGSAVAAGVMSALVFTGIIDL